MSAFHTIQTPCLLAPRRSRPLGCPAPNPRTVRTTHRKYRYPKVMPIMADELTKEEEKTDWYGVLGVGVGAEENAISKAFKKMSLRWHPDKNGGSQEAHDMFMRVKEAKLFLMDSKKRKLYDEKRAARHKMESLLAERNRNMGQRRREVREELERRENAVVNGSSSSGLGAGGEARVAAAKLDELRKQGDAKREQQSRARSAAWDLARDSAKKRRTSPGLSEGGSAATEKDGLEARTVRVKWSTKKESHSDHTLDVLFSKFGAVESVSIELGTGNRALVTFDSPQSADAAVAAYPDGKNMIARYVGKRRPKKSAFAPRRHTMSPTVSGRGGGSGAGSGEERTVNSFRDRESLVMMKMRQEAERRALLRKMAEEEGFAVPGPPGTANRGASAAVAPAGRVDGTRDIGGSGSAGPGASSGSEANATPAKPVTTATRGGEGDGVDGVYSMVNVREMEEGGGGSGTPVAAGAGTDSSGSAFSAATGIGKPAFPFATPVRPTRDVAARRKSDIPPATTNGGVGGGKSFVSSANFSASVGKIAANNPESDRAAGGGLINENDILARMMAMKR